METEDMKKARSKQKPQLRGKRWMIGIVTALSLIGIATAIWISFLNSEAIYNIESDGAPLTLVADFGSADINASGSEMIQNLTWTINNADGDVNVVIETSVLRQDDTSDACDDYQNDTNIKLFYDDIELTQPTDTMTVTGGNTDITAQATVSRFACPGNVTVSANITSV